MRVYVTARFKNAKENRIEIEKLCAAVKSAGMVDFSFIRDIENYEKTFDIPKDLWNAALKELERCDALLVDVSDSPSGGRVVEVGMAYALRKPIFVVLKKGTHLKEFYRGVANLVIEYEEIEDIISPLRKYNLGY
jgi:nucleoside 2-deoxyribosyltransferase